MPDILHPLKTRLNGLTDQWQAKGLPGHHTLMSIAKDLQLWKESQNINGLWPKQPLFLTSTLDDALGQGLSLIETWAAVLGFSVVPLGLEQSADTIINACVERQPDYLGLTVLRFDAEEELCEIGQHLPQKTRLIAGGPVFTADPDLARRAGVAFAAKDVTAFVNFFLSQL